MEDIENIIFDLNMKIRNLKKIEDSLRKSEEGYRLLAEASADVIIKHTTDGKIAYVNNAGLRLTGYSLDEITQMNIDTLVPQRHQHPVNAQSQNAAEERSSLVYEIDYVQKCGDVIPFEVSSVLVDEATGSSVLLFMRDIRQRRKTETKLEVLNS